MATRFIFNNALWEELAERVPRDHVRAAVAYLGTGASKLLPLKKEDRLVIDMSLRAVRSGVTDPREVRTFLRRGVEVFSRETLHTKFFVLGNTVIAGSSNVSRHAKDVLDEAAVLTDDGATVRRAISVFEDLCTEPVRKEYLAKCLEEYRPPKFLASGAARTSRLRKQTAKVWIIGGLRYGNEIPDSEEASVDSAVAEAETKLLDFERAEVDYSHYPTPMGFFRRLREGDWLIVCVRDGRGFEVLPPSRFLEVASYPRASGKRRYLLLCERPTDGKAVRWSAFRKAAPSDIPAAQRATPRTTAITNNADADNLLRLWDARGRFRKRR
jgi:hypothetical protein